MSVWTEVKAVLPATPDDWAAWADVFERHGVNGTLQTDHPPTISGYIAPGHEAAMPALSAELQSRGAEVALRGVPEEDWAESWKQFFKPRRVGRRFVVRPTWEPFEAGPEDRVIVLDPGQAFGTGDHPTTRLCLELLEDTPVQGREIADIGCGSGILAVGAMLLGAAKVDAVDAEAPSVEGTRQNADRNGVSVDARLGLGFEPLPDQATYDLVLSNIISAALIRLAPEAARRVRPGGQWIVSGIILANWPDVRAAAERHGFTLTDHREEGDWCAATFRR